MRPAKPDQEKKVYGGVSLHDTTVSHRRGFANAIAQTAAWLQSKVGIVVADDRDRVLREMGLG